MRWPRGARTRRRSGALQPQARAAPALITFAERVGNSAVVTVSVRLPRSYFQPATVLPLTVTARGAPIPTNRTCHERLDGAPAKPPRAGAIVSDGQPLAAPLVVMWVVVYAPVRYASLCPWS